MAKLTGPLLSQEAHGSLSKILTFSRRKSGSQVRDYNKPTGTPSPSQRAKRRITEFLVAQWQNMTAAEKDAWAASAASAGLALSGYHYFLREAQRDIYTHTKLWAYWPCNEYIGGNIIDKSGCGNTLSPVPAGVTTRPQPTPSRILRFSNALIYNGNYLRAAAGNSMIPSGIDFTIEAWLYCEGEKSGTSDSDGGVYGNATWQSTQLGLALRRNTAGNLQIIWGTNRTNYTDILLIPAITTTNKKKWFCVVITYDSSETKLYRYVDGKLIGSSVKQYGTTSLRFMIGRSSDLNAASNNWYGRIDEVCIYKRLLSLEEIRTRYKMAFTDV